MQRRIDERRGQTRVPRALIRGLEGIGFPGGAGIPWRTILRPRHQKFAAIAERPNISPGRHGICIASMLDSVLLFGSWTPEEEAAPIECMILVVRSSYSVSRC